MVVSIGVKVGTEVARMTGVRIVLYVGGQDGLIDRVTHQDRYANRGCNGRSK